MSILAWSLIGFFAIGIFYTLYRVDAKNLSKWKIFNEEVEKKLDLFLEKAKNSFDTHYLWNLSVEMENWYNPIRQRFSRNRSEDSFKVYGFILGKIHALSHNNRA